MKFLPWVCLVVSLNGKIDDIHYKDLVFHSFKNHDSLFLQTDAQISTVDLVIELRPTEN